MIGIDTNILVRYLTQDDKVQSEQAAKLIDKCAGKSGTIFINNIVICELIGVLEIDYKKADADFSDILIGKLNLLNVCSQTYSFDVKAAKSSMFTMME